jgi:hypothetical protein
MTGNQPAIPGITCPICGLRFTVAVDDDDMTIMYVMEEWQQRCPSATLGSPSLCPSFSRGVEPVLSMFASLLVGALGSVWPGDSGPHSRG